MFSGKKEKALEEQLRTVTKQKEHKKELLGQIAGKEDQIVEQFARVTASRAQMERDMQQVEEHLQHVTEMVRGSESTAGNLQSEIIRMNNAVESFDANHAIFVRQRKEQDEKIMEIVENNKHFTMPMKYISEAPTAMKEEQQKMLEKAARMQEFSKNMEVLSLNAAIEAGRMGEAGVKFIAAAEEIRAFSENHEKEVLELEEALKQSDARTKELEEQIHRLNELLKENNISMGKLLKDGMMSMASYQTGQIELRNVISQNAIEKVETLAASEKENGKVHERMQLQLGDIRDEIEEQKNSMDELETIFKELQQSAKKGRAD